MDIGIHRLQHLEAGVDEKCTKDVSDSMEAVNQSHATGYENAARDQRTDDPPEQNLVLIGGINPKVAKQHKEDEKVIDAERFLNQVAGGELQGLLLALPKQKKDGKGGGERNPERAPGNGLLEADDVGSAMKQAELMRKQHQKQEKEKKQEQ